MGVDKMRITKVYTRTGDKGETSLANGDRVKKNHPRIQSYGTVDELNSILGICLEYLQTNSRQMLLLRPWLLAIQNDLFNIGSDLATPVESRWPNMMIVDEKQVLALEKMIDHLQKDLSPLKEFVLPGGNILNAYFHLARTVCRRAERESLSLLDVLEVNPFVIKYLNRLSDLCFVLSRWVCLGTTENTWQKELGVAQLVIGEVT